jgi:coenzyme Q-binding protein COQ10
MASFKAARRVPVSADAAFHVAADVGAYEDFLPLLQRSTVRGTRQATDDGERFQAELVVAYEKLRLREAFVSSVETFVGSRRVVAMSSDGPFKSLNAEWQIAEAGTACDVTIIIDYQLHNKLLQMVLAGAMDFAVAQVMKAFEQRVLALQ